MDSKGTTVTEEQAPLLDNENRDVEANKPVVEKKVPKTFHEIKWIFLGISISVFVSALSATVVSNLQIDIASTFKAASLSSWIGSSYLLGLAAMTPLWGRFCEMMGRRHSIMVSLWLFLIGTVLCMVAPSMGFLIVARGITGAGGGGMLAVTAIILSDLVSLRDRGIYHGGINLLFGFGSAVGAVVGGWIGDRLGWRYAFLLQVPILLIGMFLVWWHVHLPVAKSERTAWEKFKRVDWAGVFTLVTSISSFMLGATLVTAFHWSLSNSMVILLGITSVLTFVLFVIAERSALEPIMPLELLTHRSPVLIMVACMLLTATTFARMFYLPVYLHIVRGLDGKTTGLLLLPSSVVGAASSLLAGWYMRKTGYYKAFSVVMSFLPTIQSFIIIMKWGLHTNLHELWFEMAWASVGGGGIMTSMITAIIANVEPKQVSMAVAAVYLFRAVGQVLGGVISGAAQQQVLTNALQRRLADQGKDVIDKIINEPTIYLPTLPEAVREQAIWSYLESIDAVFWFTIVGGVALTACCIGMAGKHTGGR